MTFVSIKNEIILCYKGNPNNTFSGYYRYIDETKKIQEIVVQDGKPKSRGKFLMSPLDDNGNFINQENKPIWLK